MDRKNRLSHGSLLDSFHKIDNFMLFDETQSTNDTAKRYISEIPRPFVIAAKSQSGGKGRMGRSFYSPADTGIYFSLVLDAKDDIKDTMLITSLASVITAESIRKLTGKDARIKWVNDIYIGNRKVCGILCELVSDKNNDPLCVIAGIGINTDSIFPSDLDSVAGNIGDTDQNALLCMICDDLAAEYENIDERSFIKRYRELSMVLGKNITYIKNGAEYTALAEDIDDNGCLIVRKDGIKDILSSGEISLRLDQN